MKKLITILGILLAVTILISGSAVASWHYGMDIYDYQDCTNVTEALDAPDLVHATLGVGGGSPELGWVIIDLDADSLGDDQEFWVYASSTVYEPYKLRLHTDGWGFRTTFLTGNDDTTDESFMTPSYPTGVSWRYIEIWSEAGSTNGTDPIYGSEIDAVGYEI